jgi:hypothetical protein
LNNPIIPIFQMSDTEVAPAESSETPAEPAAEPLAGTVPVPGVSYPLKVQYCGECTLPLEYCAHGGRSEKCKAWFEKNLSQLVAEGLQINDDEPKEGEAVEDKKSRKRGGKGQPKNPTKVHKRILL